MDKQISLALEDFQKRVGMNAEAWAAVDHLWTCGNPVAWHDEHRDLVARWECGNLGVTFNSVFAHSRAGADLTSGPEARPDSSPDAAATPTRV